MIVGNGLRQVDHANLRYLLTQPPGEDHLLEVDLESAWFIDAAAVAAIAALTDGAKRTGTQITFAPPSRREPSAYISRMGIRELLDEMGVQHSLPTVTHHPPGIRFVELKRLEPESVEECVDVIEAHMRTWNDDTLCTLISDALLELALNIEEHAGQAGFVAGQHYPKLKCFRFCVADSGIGIPASIRIANMAKPGEEDHEIVERAASSRLSRKSKDGGFGLMNIVHAATRHPRGAVEIFSSLGHTRFAHGVPPRSSRHSVSSPGTLISVELPY